jgi:hypothetical protein
MKAVTCQKKTKGAVVSKKKSLQPPIKKDRHIQFFWCKTTIVALFMCVLGGQGGSNVGRMNVRVILLGFVDIVE